MVGKAGQHPANNGPLWRCACDCGGETIKMTSGLKLKGRRSCPSCFSSVASEIKLKGRLHTQSKELKRLYHIWNDMLQRCSNKKIQCYKWYGGKGVSVCDDWMNFRNFEKWSFSSGYSERMTINRIDSSGDYEPSNCDWVTRSENTKKMIAEHRARGTGVFAN